MTETQLEKIAEIAAKRAELEKELRDAVIQADREGISKTAIALAAKINRNTVYSWTK